MGFGGPKGLSQEIVPWSVNGGTEGKTLCRCSCCILDFLSLSSAFEIR